MKNNAWAVWGLLRLGGPGPAGPLDKTALRNQFDRLVVPGTRRFSGHRIKHMGPGQRVVFGYLVAGCTDLYILC